MTINTSAIELNVNNLREDEKLKGFLDDLSGHGQCVIFGGAVRDWLLGKKPRDIDIVIQCPSYRLAFLSKAQMKYKGVQNRFDGWKVPVNGVEFDIWALESTWAMKNDSQFIQTLPTIIPTPFLSLDAIAYRMDNGEIYENGFQQTMDTRTLDIIYEPNPFPYLCVSKALCAMDKYNLMPSDKLKDYIQEQHGKGYKKHSFEKYNEMMGLNYSYEDCMRRVS